MDDLAAPQPRPDPYPPNGMEQVLARLMKINNFQWSSADAQGTIIGSVNLPGDLFAIASVWCRAGRFRYFSADLELEVRLNATDFHSGQLLAYTIPDTNSAEVTLLVKDLWNASQLEPQLILAQSCTQIKWTIPYQHQFDFIDLKNVSNDPASMAYVGFVVLTPLLGASTSATSTVDVTVWARFVNVHITGPVSTEYTKPTLLKTKKLKLPCPKPMRVLGDWELKPESGEQEIRSKTGVANAATRMSAFKANFTSNPVESIASTLLDPIGSIMGLIGLDKPDSLKTSERIITDPNANVFHATGIDPASTVSLDPRQYVADDQSAYGKNDPCCLSFRAYAQRPSLLEVLNVPSSTTSGSTIAIFRPGPFPKWSTVEGGIRYDNFYAMAARHFMLWRGSTKFMFVFSASKYVTARFRVSWVPFSDTNIEATNGGDVINQIIDVKGDTVTKITIPYLSPKPYSVVPSPTTAQSSYIPNGLLRLTLVNDIVCFDSTLSTTSIACSVWVGAGPDIDFAIPYKFPEPVPPFEIRPEGDIIQAFTTQFPPIIASRSFSMKHYTTPESVMGIRSYVHRFFRYATVEADTVFTLEGLYPPINPPTGIPPVWNLFRFRRGGMKFRCMALAQANVVFGYCGSDDGVRIVGSDSDWTTSRTQLGPQIPEKYWTVPYAANCKYLKRDFQSIRDIQFIIPYVAQSGASSMIYIAAGDDISFGAVASLPTIGA